VRTRRARLLSPGDEWARSPAWAPNGRTIAFVRTPVNSDRGRLAVMRPDGSGLRNLAPHLQDVVDLAWSPEAEMSPPRRLSTQTRSSLQRRRFSCQR
jgi:Tol biopolymer transport system component